METPIFPESKESVDESIPSLDGQLKSFCLLKALKVQGHDVDWTEYSKLYVAHFRGFHFYENKFTEEERTFFRQQMQEVSSPIYSLGVFDMAVGSAFWTPEQKELLDNAAEKLVDAIGQMDRNDPTPLRSKQYEKPLYACLQEYVQAFQSFLRAQQDRAEIKGSKKDQLTLSEIFDAIPTKENPFISTSSSAKHALKYGSGDFIVGGYGADRLFPQYNRNTLVAKNKCLGVVSILLHSLPELANSGAISTLQLNSSGNLNLDCRHDRENETIFVGKISSKYIVYHEEITVPDLDEYRAEYQVLYGLSQKTFSFHSNEIRNSRDENQEEMEKKFIKKLYDTKKEVALRLCEKAKLEAERRNGQLIEFEQLNSIFPASPPGERYDKAKVAMRSPVRKFPQLFSKEEAKHNGEEEKGEKEPQETNKANHIKEDKHNKE